MTSERKVHKPDPSQKVWLAGLCLALVPWPWSANITTTNLIRIVLVGLAGLALWQSAGALSSWQTKQLRNSLASLGGILVAYILWRWRLSDGSGPISNFWVGKVGIHPWVFMMALNSLAAPWLAAVRPEVTREIETTKTKLVCHPYLYSAAMTVACVVAMIDWNYSKPILAVLGLGLVAVSGLTTKESVAVEEARSLEAKV